LRVQKVGFSEGCENPKKE